MTSKNINLYEDYTKFQSGHQQSLALDFPIFIKKDDPVRLLNEILEGLNYTHLNAAYSDKGRKSGIPPVNMFKILVFAEMCRTYSSRDIADLCQHDIRFMWLLQGYQAPAHDAISRFRTQRLAGGVMEDLFSQFVMILHELDEVKFENIFIDGTKIEANAGRYTFVWLKATSKFQVKLYKKVAEFVPVYETRYLVDVSKTELEIIDLLRVMRIQLKERIESENIVFVYGKGKRKPQLQRDLEKVEEWLETETKYLTHQKTAKGRSSFSKTDKDATFMRLKDDHMQNGQLKPAYNVQIGVEAEYIVHAKLFPLANDLNTLIPFLDSFEEIYKQKYKNIVADAGYESEENYSYLKLKGYTSYIKPVNHEQLKKKSFKKQIGRRENMEYDSENDVYTCANGKRLSVAGEKISKTKTGYERTVTVYECEDCEECPVRQNCTKAKVENNKKIEVSKKMAGYREESYSNILSETGIDLRMNRSIQVEGAFGVLKENYGLRRFLHRGEGKVTVEFLLLAFAYNVKKLHSKIQNKRLGSQLHERKVA
jgi:transposase